MFLIVFLRKSLNSKFFIVAFYDICMKQMNINWNKYSEEEIHTIICLLYQSLDYHIRNLHKADRANEKGADIVVEKGEEKIAIAVKIKPTKKDRDQVIDLSNREELKKIYIYIQTPTDKFQDFILEFKEKIEFWDYKKLNDFFREKHPYFMANIIFDESELHHELEQVKFLLFYLREVCSKLKKEPIKKLNKNDFLILWRLKDVAVTLYKTNELFSPLLKTPMNFKNDKFNEHFVELFLDYLEMMYTHFNLFTKHFLEFYQNNKSLVHNGVIRGITTSHWYWLGGFKVTTNINDLRHSLEKAIDDQETLEKLKKDFPDEEKNKRLEKELLIESKGNSVWKAMGYQVTKLELFGRALEIIIDDIMGEYLDLDVYLFNLENLDFSKMMDENTTEEEL